MIQISLSLSLHLSLSPSLSVSPALFFLVLCPATSSYHGFPGRPALSSQLRDPWAPPGLPASWLQSGNSPGSRLGQSEGSPHLFPLSPGSLSCTTWYPCSKPIVSILCMFHFSGRSINSVPVQSFQLALARELDLIQARPVMFSLLGLARKPRGATVQGREKLSGQEQ